MDVIARNCCLLQIQEEDRRTYFQIATSVWLIARGTEEINDKSGGLASSSTVFGMEKYQSLHPRLAVIVADCIFNMDTHMELPFSLMNILKGREDAGTGDMAGLDGDPAALLRIYLDVNRIAEVTALLLEYPSRANDCCYIEYCSVCFEDNCL